MRKTVKYTSRLYVTETMLRSLHFSQVLEVGAGDYSFDYLKDVKGSWTKIDFSPPCNILCDLNSPELVLPIETSSFDLVICTEVLEHLLWPQRLLAELNRLLLPGGNILLSVPNISSLSYRIAWALGRIPSCAASGNLPVELGSTAYISDTGNLLGGHVIDFNKRRLVLLLKSTGFDPVLIKGSGIIWHRQVLPHWLVPPSLSSNIICLARKV